MLTLAYFHGPGPATTKDESVVTPVIVGVAVPIIILAILSSILCVTIVVKKRRQQQSYKCHHDSKKILCKIRNLRIIQ